MNNTVHLHHGGGRIALPRFGGAVTACLSLALVPVIATAARAQAVLERKIIADDARAFDRFGHSVSIAGNTAIIGEPGGQLVLGDSARSGFAYVFDATTGGQLSKLNADDGESADEGAGRYANPKNRQKSSSGSIHFLATINTRMPHVASRSNMRITTPNRSWTRS